VNDQRNVEARKEFRCGKRLDFSLEDLCLWCSEPRTHKGLVLWKVGNCMCTKACDKLYEEGGQKGIVLRGRRVLIVSSVRLKADDYSVNRQNRRSGMEIRSFAVRTEHQYQDFSEDLEGCFLQVYYFDNGILVWSRPLSVPSQCTSFMPRLPWLIISIIYLPLV